MSRLMRRAYGHGGTRLERIIVCAPPQRTPPMPLWLKIPAILLLIAIPFLIARYAVPTATLVTRTLIDISKLTLKPPPPPPPKPKLMEPEPVKPLPRKVEPPPIAAPIVPQIVQKQPERHTILPITEEAQRPVISRARPAVSPGDNVYQPRVLRERRQLELPGGTSAGPTRIRREATTGEAPAQVTSITRSRGATASPMDATYSKERVGVVRRTSPAGLSSSSGAGIGTSSQPTAIRRGRAFGPGGEEAPAPRQASVTRERARSGTAGTGSGSTGATSGGLSRGISLMSLEICSSAQLQEEKIKNVLSVVGDQHSCKSNKGEFQFRGTQRVSSFNLMIFPSHGRIPSNRCEELEYAYTCLKNQ